MRTPLMALTLAAALNVAQAAEPAASMPAAPATAQTTTEAIAQANAATQVAQSWLAQVDAGDLKASWTASATAFRAAVTEAQWQQAVAAARGPLGKLQARQPLSAKPMHGTPPGMPEGDYMALQFKAAFQNRPEVVEQVTLVQEQGGWKVIGYFLK